MADPVPRPWSEGTSSLHLGRQPSEPAPPAREPAPETHYSEAEQADQRKWLQIGLVLLAGGLWFVGNGYYNHFTAAGNFKQGLALQKDRKCTEAIVKLDQALSYDPEMVEAYHVRAICHWRGDRFDQALADYNATVRLKPDYAAGYASRGAVHRQKGNLDAALADWDMAIRLDPAPAYPRMRRAEVLRERDDFDGALKEYDLLIARDGKDREARMGRAALLRDKGDFDGALAEYDAILALLRDDPITAGGNQSSTPFFARVATLREKGAIDAALAEVEKGIALWPDIPSGYRERALIALFHADRPAAAAADFAEALDKGFRYRRAELLWAAGGEALGIEVTDRGWKFAPDTPFVPAIYDPVIQGHLARVRAGTADPDKLLKDVEELGQRALVRLLHRRDMSFPDWPGPLLKLFLGTMTPDEVRAAAHAPGRDARHRACAADFYLARISRKSARTPTRAACCRRQPTAVRSGRRSAALRAPS